MEQAAGPAGRRAGGRQERRREHMYPFVHNTLGMCVWDLAAIITAIGMAAVLVTHHIRQRKREKDFEKEHTV